MVIDVSHFRAPRDHVIQLVRNCREKVSLVVCQPPLDNVSCNLAPFFSLQNIQNAEDYKVYITDRLMLVICWSERAARRLV